MLGVIFITFGFSIYGLPEERLYNHKFELRSWLLNNILYGGYNRVRNYGYMARLVLVVYLNDMV